MCITKSTPEYVSTMLEKVIEELKKQFPKQFASHGEQLCFVLSKYVRAEEINYLGNPDLDLLLFWKKEIEHLQEENDLNLLQKIIVEAIAAIKHAYIKRITILEKVPLEELKAWSEQLLDVDAKIHATTLKLQIAQVCHDLYWDFHQPFQLVIDFAGFIDLYEQRKFTEGQSVANQVNLLASMKNWITSYATGEFYQRLYLSHAEIAASLHTNKLNYLRNLSTKALEDRKQRKTKKLKVQIIGAGPGGLMRALVALIKGATVTIFEKRLNFTTRQNVVKLLNLAMLDFFGVTLELIATKKSYPIMSKYLYVQIGDLQKALVTLIKSISKSKSIIKRCRDENEKQLLTQKNDLLVDASGSRAVLAKLTNNPPEILAEKTIMVAGLFKDVLPSGAIVEEEIMPTKALKQLSLPTPSNWCEVILPDQDTQNKLALLTQKILHLEHSPAKNELTQLRKNKTCLIKDIALQAAYDDPYLSKSPKITKKNIENAWMFEIVMLRRTPSVLHNGCLLMQSGDALVISDPLAALGCTMALRGAMAFSLVLEWDGKNLEKLNFYQHYYNFGAHRQIHFVTERSFQARGDHYCKKTCHKNTSFIESSDLSSY